MKLYQTIDGTLIGFYKEKGGAVQALLYRDIYEKQLVTKYSEEEVITPGHYERQMVWHPEYYVTRYYWREAHPARGLVAAWIPYQHLMPAGYKETRVWIPEKVEIVEVEYQDLEDVWVGREPVYEYIDPMFVQGYEVLELIPAPADRPDLEDSITIRNTETGEVLTTTATYIGLAEQIDDNEYVVP